MSASTRKKLKLSMFQRASLASSKILPGVSEGMFCPLCTQLITDIDLLTLEHVPQKSMGGRELCLTCKKCNSEAGHQFEHYLQNEATANAPFSENPVRGFWESDGVRVNGDVSLVDGCFKLKTIGEINNPKNLSYMENIFPKKSSGRMTFNIDIKYDKRKVDIAYLKSAYLALYAKYGYRVIRHSAYNIVREQIREPDKILIPKYRLYIKDNALPKYTIIASVYPIRVVFVKIENCYVALPDAVDDGESIYDWIYARKEESLVELNFEIQKVIDWPTPMELSFDFKE